MANAPAASNPVLTSAEPQLLIADISRSIAFLAGTAGFRLALAG